MRCLVKPLRHTEASAAPAGREHTLRLFECATRGELQLAGRHGAVLLEDVLVAARSDARSPTLAHHPRPADYAATALMEALQPTAGAAAVHLIALRPYPTTDAPLEEQRFKLISLQSCAAPGRRK